MRGLGVLTVGAGGGGGRRRAASAAEPTFVNGLAQSVFTANTADWIRGEGWVQSNDDSDHDGKLDRIHFDVTRPKETATGLKVPTIMEASPYYANLGPEQQLVGRPRDRRAAAGAGVPAELRDQEHEPEDRDDFEARGCRAGSRSCTPRTPARALRRLPDRRRAERERRDEGRRRLAQRPRAGVHHPRRAHADRRRLGDRQGRHDGHVLQRLAADRGRRHRRRRGWRRSSRSRPSRDYYEYYRANGMVRGPGGWQGEDSDVLVDVVYTRQDETYPRMKCRAADRADRPRRGPRHAATATRSGTSATSTRWCRTCTRRCCSRTATTTTT